MKTIGKTLGAVALAMLTAAAVPVLAQPGFGPGAAAPPYARAGAHPRLERLATLLELTDEQKAQVQGILTEQREKRVALHEETRARLETVLTPEQVQRLEQVRDRRGWHRGGRGWGRGPGGPG